MKTIFFVRHAESSFKPFEKDIDRTLTSSGKRNAEEMARKLLEKELIPENFISSPAERAIETASIFMDALGTNDKDLQIENDLYEPTVQSFYKVIENIPDSIDSVIIFSHNPSITLFINELDCQPVFDIPTCGVYVIEIETKDWSEFQISDKSFLMYAYPEG